MSRRKLILTGAGFTANFGAPLASEMWNWVYSAEALREHEKLLEKMRLNLDFERVYFEVTTGLYSDDQKRAMVKAVMGAFRDVDDIVRRCNPYQHVSTTALDTFLASFAGLRGNRGYIFTLNQDLYLERWYLNDIRPLLPGIPPNAVWRNPSRRETPLEQNDYIRVPDEAAVREYRERFGQHNTFAYLKLHGSTNWLSPSGQSQMVLGAQKRESIDAEPLLRWYMDLFCEVLNERNRLLLIIGYGFGDSHINTVIADAIVNSGLKFVVVNPSTTENLLRTMRVDRQCGEVLERGMASHVPHTLREIFPPRPSVVLQSIASAGWTLLKRDFFDQPE